MFSAIHSLLTSTEVNFSYKWEFWRKETHFFGLLIFACSTKMHSPRDKSHFAKCVCLTFTWYWSTENGNTFSGRLECGNAAVSFSKPNNQCFHEKGLHVWRLELGGLNSVLFFLSTCSVVSVYLWSKWLTVNEREENWYLRINFFSPCTLNNKVEVQRELCGCVRSLRLLLISERKD